MKKSICIDLFSVIDINSQCHKRFVLDLANYSIITNAKRPKLFQLMAQGLAKIKGIFYIHKFYNIFVSRFFNRLNSRKLISYVLICLASLPLHATDYTRMAQDILRSSQAETKNKLSDAKKTATDLRKSLPEQGSFYGFDVKDLKLKTDEDIKKFIKGHSCKKGKLTPFENPKSEVSNSSLMVFVSFGLSDSILKALHDQVKNLGGRLVVRGLVNDSFPDTQERLKTLGISVDIHPVWFTNYDVQRVPTFVIKDGDRFDKVSGNVSCYEALEAIQSDGELKEKVISLLNKEGETYAG